MKKAIAVIMVLAVSLMVLSGCVTSDARPNSHGKVIYTSFYPMYFLTSEIAGDKAEIICMVPAGAEPHNWEPTPKMAVGLNNADMLIYNGAGMEAWIDNILTIIDRDKTKVVDASEGIELIKSEEHFHEGEHEEGHDHGLYDPHIWVSPLRAMQQAQIIYDALIEVDPDNSGYYERNYSNLKSRLTKLDKDIREASGSFESNVIVVSHEAFGYFAKDYAFRQIAIKGINPQEEPSPGKMQELVKECRRNNVKYIFFESLTSPRLSQALARELKVGTLVLNNAAGLGEEDKKSGKDYITVMYENLENLKKALGD